MKTPRNLQFNSCSIGSMAIFKVFPRVFLFPFGWNNIQLDVFTFNASLIARPICKIMKIRVHILYKSSMHPDDKNTVVSSAKYINLECVKQFAMSFT